MHELSKEEQFAELEQEVFNRKVDVLADNTTFQNSGLATTEKTKEMEKDSKHLRRL